MAAAPYWTVQMIPLGINPASLPNLLWWIDTPSITPAPGNGAAITSIANYPGTPTARLGVSTGLSALSLSVPAIYRTGLTPAGAAGVDFRGTYSGGVQTAAGPGFAQQGVAATSYLTNAAQPITLYTRFYQYAGGLTIGSEAVLTDVLTANPPWIRNDTISSTTVCNYAVYSNANLKTPVTGPGAHTHALTLGVTGTQLQVWLDGVLMGTDSVGTATWTTNANGLGWVFGNKTGALPIETPFALVSQIAYQALHDAKTIKGVSQWLAGHR